MSRRSRRKQSGVVEQWPVAESSDEAPDLPDNPSQMMQVTSEIITLTPELAHEFLSRNTHNRNVSSEKVDQYAGAIRRGEWALNGEAIKFDRNGTMQDGQHRCLGVVKAGRPIKTLLITGLEPSAQETMDTGKKRSISDMLKLRGEKNTPRIAGTLNLIYAYVKAGTLYSGGVRPAPTPQQIFAFFEKHEDVRDNLYPPRSEVVDRMLSPSISSALYYLFSHVDDEDAQVFFEYLATGSNLSASDPIHVLRERLLREVAKPHGRIAPHVRGALAIKAFNAWREGKKMSAIRWSAGGAHGEPFPRVKECAIIPETDRHKL
jgi:hypothetical protein